MSDAQSFEGYQEKLADDIAHIRMLLSLTADHYTDEDLAKANTFLDQMEFVSGITVTKLNREQRREIEKHGTPKSL